MRALVFLLLPLFLALNGCQNSEEFDCGIILSEASEMYVNQDFNSAIEKCWEGLKNNCNEDDRLWELLSSCYMSVGNDSAAYRMANICLEYNPSNAAALLYRGMIYDKSGEFLKASFDFEKSLKINDSLFQTHSSYALNSFKRGNKGLAVFHANRAYELGGDIADLAQLCAYYCFDGNTQKSDSLLLILEEENYVHLKELQQALINCNQ